MPVPMRKPRALMLSGFAKGATTSRVKATFAMSQKNLAKLSFCFSVRMIFTCSFASFRHQRINLPHVWQGHVKEHGRGPFAVPSLTYLILAVLFLLLCPSVPLQAEARVTNTAELAGKVFDHPLAESRAAAEFGEMPPEVDEFALAGGTDPAHLVGILPFGQEICLPVVRIAEGIRGWSVLRVFNARDGPVSTGEEAFDAQHSSVPPFTFLPEPAWYRFNFIASKTAGVPLASGPFLSIAGGLISDGYGVSGFCVAAVSKRNWTVRVEPLNRAPLFIRGTGVSVSGGAFGLWKDENHVSGLTSMLFKVSGVRVRAARREGSWRRKTR